MRTEDLQVSAKEPWLAVFLSKLLPGTGQIYAGGKAKGFTILLLFVLFSLTVLTGLLIFIYSDDVATSRLYALIGIASVPAVVILAIYSLFDAHRTAKKFNARHQLEAVSAPKEPWLAVFLSSFLPGVGQLYNRQVLKGIVFIIVALILDAVTSFFYPLFALAIPLYFFAFKDAFESSESINSSNRKFFDREGTLVKFFVAGVILLDLLPVSEIARAHVIQAFKIPAGSMLPTLAIGDHILVNKTPSARASIARGDLVVFKYPEDPSRDFVKRVIAVGGDLVEAKDKKIYVNGKAMDEPYVQHTDAKIHPAGVDPRDNFGPYVVPENKFLVMGDNRDQSYDSRYWGYVPREDIKGKAFKIYWSWDAKTGKVRWDRIGKKIR